MAVEEPTVDTSLDPIPALGVEGVDAPSLDFAAPTFTVASRADFQEAASSQSMTFTGGTSAAGKRGAVIAYAKQFLGTPYKWGGAAPGGFDCSGLVQYAFAKNGVSLPRVAFQQAAKGKRVAISSLQPGDLVAWDEGGNIGIGHIAIYLGNGQILEAPRTGLNVRIRSLGKGGFDSGAFGVQMDY
jgi:cell wall-associated NlpC family hydrolase